jgi:NADPH:quinone reductase-like Zn-dependent oxidoreductase
MRAIQVSSVGEPSAVLNCVSSSTPCPGRGEVLVKMLASPVNPSDLMFIRGIYGQTPELPQIPGFEGVGIVEASGGGLKGRLFMGKRVAVLNPRAGNWSEYTVVPASRVIPLNDRLSVPQAATFFVNPATALVMTQDVLKIPRDAWLLQTAATSALGRMIIRLGNAQGFRTINVVRREDAVPELQAAGAAHVVVFDPTQHSANDLQRAVQDIVGSAGLHYAIDPVGGETAAAVLSALSTHGRMLLFGSLSGSDMPLSSRILLTKNASIEGFWLSHFMNSKGLIFKLKLIKRITRLILDGTLQTDIRQTWSLDQIQSAVAAAEQPGQSGRVLLSIAES